MTNHDIELVRDYAAHQSEQAFETLVSRHVNWVYSAALRQAHDPHLAEEITQAVFIILAKKSASLTAKTILSGWLYRTACYAAKDALRAQRRRQHYEQEAYMQSTLHEAQADSAWQELSPLLDEAMMHLGQSDRDALVLRFFENKNSQEIGAAIGLSGEAAKKRVSRALEKLRLYFFKRGIKVSTGVLSGAISAHSVSIAPATLAKTAAAAAFVKGSAASASTLTLVKGALKIMAWTKAKMAIAASAGILLAIGTTTVTVKEIQEHRTYPWQISGFDSRVLNRQPPQVRILPSKVKNGSSWGNTRVWSDTHDHLVNKFMGTGVTAVHVISAAYDFPYSPARIILPAQLPRGKYDYIASLPGGNEAALQQEARKKLGLISRREIRDTDVLLLEVQYPDAPGLKPNRQNPGGTSSSDSEGHWTIQNGQLSTLAMYLESILKTPVIDRTGLTNHFDIDLKWRQPSWRDVNPAGLKTALLNQLGLELVPSNMPVEMLVVEKVE